MGVMPAESQLSSSFISVCVNGQATEVPEGQSVAELLALLNIAADRVAVEMNHSIVRKRDWRQTAVTSGSNIEIVEFVGGG
jgi:sulfur carrier protein